MSNIKSGMKVRGLLLGMMLIVMISAEEELSENRRHLREREGHKLIGYIPTCKSGVTISTGVDLGQQSEDGLKKKGVPDAIIKKLKPYLGLKTRCAVKKAKLKPEDLVLTAAEAKTLEDIFIAENEKISVEYSTKMGKFGQAVLVSLRHWAKKWGNTDDKKLGFNGVRHVWDAIENKDATLDDLKTALEKTLKLHTKGTGGYNRIQHEIDYIEKNE